MLNIVNNKIIQKIIIFTIVCLFIASAIMLVNGFVESSKIAIVDAFQIQAKEVEKTTAYRGVLNILLDNKKEEESDVNEEIESVVDEDGYQELVISDNIENEENIEKTFTVENISVNDVEVASTNVENVQVQENLSLDNYQGYSAVGRIEIPKTNVNTAILSNVSVNGMKIAPCFMYSTGEFNVSGDSYIVGHNLCNNTLFSNNNLLEAGDKVYITSVDGNRVEYIIYSKFITDENDTSYLKRVIGDKPEITLQCCTNDESGRIIILARAE